MLFQEVGEPGGQPLRRKARRAVQNEGAWGRASSRLICDSMQELSDEKQFAFDYVDRNARAIAILGDNIFYFGELGMQEFETANLMSGLLEKGGLAVERGVAGLPTPSARPGAPARRWWQSTPNTIPCRTTRRPRA